MLLEGFMVGLGMFGFLYALITAPDDPISSYVLPHASPILLFGFVYALGIALRFQYDEWRKRAERGFPTA